MKFGFGLLMVAGLPACLARHSDVPVNLLLHHASHLIEGQHGLQFVAEFVTADEFDRFKIYAQYAGASYCGNQKAGEPMFCNGDICPTKGQNATYHSGLKKKGLLNFLPLVTPRNIGHVSIDHDLGAIVISLRGTRFWEWFYNVRWFPIAWESKVCVGCRVHVGFNAVASYVRPLVTDALLDILNTESVKGYDIVVTGHSLGGATATIVAAHLRIDLGTNVTTYTFGAPRVGNVEFAEFVRGQGDRNYRITHFNDIVPMVPGLLEAWRHVEPEYWLPQKPCLKVDYKIEDIEQCLQSNSTQCIESHWPHWPKPEPLKIPGAVCSHLFYLCSIAGCGNIDFNWRHWLLPFHWTEKSSELVGNDLSAPAGFAASVQDDFARDIAYAASLSNDSLLLQHREFWQDN